MSNLLVEVPPHSDFTLDNLPFGIFSIGSDAPRAGVAIGRKIIDLVRLSQYCDLGFDPSVLDKSYLNEFIRLGRGVTTDLRLFLRDLLQDDGSALAKYPEILVEQHLATMHLPVQIGDYTDFYSSRHHAENVGKLFRDPANALLPNWEHLPVAYHGRSSSIVVSGTPITRPFGQSLMSGSEVPVFGPSKELDFELEVAMVIGQDSALGSKVGVANAQEYIFGLLLFNDWSARDIQRWEYRPLGPFLGKSFASTVSPWIITMDALEPFKCSTSMDQSHVLPYLKDKEAYTYDIDLFVEIADVTQNRELIVKSNFKHLYWTMAQQIAHHTSNGCNLRVGDLMASGTISGPGNMGKGSLLELSQGGRQPWQLSDGHQRTYLQDGDQVILRGFSEKNGMRVGFGEATGRIFPARF